ncbi:MAG: DNA (cytosine-5-)-methyltransferase, partial [Okeania sp. SIO2D1]|nr:DNA (cytosine-5-)-methyltransferase [Okeania sp. SIO2D1]
MATKLTQLDLCSGVGAGFCLAGVQLGLQLQACAEIEPYCCDILAKRYPKAYNLGDINECQWDSIKADLGDIDLISASPPCQPFSIQGKRQGAKDKRDCI